VRGRDVLAALIGLLVVAGAIGGAWWWFNEETEPADAPAEPGDSAAVTAEAFLTAWQERDGEAMTALSREPPDDLAERHEQLWDGLGATDLRLQADALDEQIEGRASQQVRVAVDVPELSEPVVWDTSLELVRQGGRWAVEWSLATVHPELRPNWHFDKETEQLGRAPILATDGTPLADEGELVVFGFEPSGVSDPDAMAAAFDAAIPGTGQRVAAELARSDLVDGWFYPLVTVGTARAEIVAAETRDVDGVMQRQRSGRALYAEGFARHVVGVVDEATAEQLEELGAPYAAGDEVGQFGLERAFERQLVSGQLVRAGLRDGDDGPLRVVLAEGTDQDTGAVSTTLDVAVQQAIENTLLGISEPTAIVVIDGSDGAVRGSASRPLGAYNRAWDGRYRAGPTAALIVSEAALAEGTDPDQTIACPGRTRIGGLEIANPEDTDLGEISLPTAFATACRTAFATLGAELGDEALLAAAARFGFGVEPDLPLTAVGGSFPTPIDTAELGSAASGQARVEVSPLHVASMAAATVDGTWHAPWILADDGPAETRALTDGAGEMLTEFLLAGPRSGTATEAAVDDEQVGGVTGTVQGSDGAVHDWFLGTWEGLGFAVLLEDVRDREESAATIAGRLVREIATQAGAVADQPDADSDDANGDEDADADGDEDAERDANDGSDDRDGREELAPGDAEPSEPEPDDDGSEA
jgi:cell division protein FtsI/penicillin-binding protein 2